MSGSRIFSPAFPIRPQLAICWPSLDEEEYAYQLEGVTAWLDWLVPTFALDARTVPSCWREHGALVEELSALYTAWTVAFCPTSEGERPLEWLGAFAMARERLRDWNARSGCRPEEHRSEAPRAIDTAEA